MMEEICGIPVLGVIPYYHDIYIEEEDSVELSLKQRKAVQERSMWRWYCSVISRISLISICWSMTNG